MAHIEYQYGHYVVLDENGNFLCSADTYREAMTESNLEESKE